MRLVVTHVVQSSITPLCLCVLDSDRDAPSWRWWETECREPEKTSAVGPQALCPGRLTSPVSVSNRKLL